MFSYDQPPEPLMAEPPVPQHAMQPGGVHRYPAQHAAMQQHQVPAAADPSVVSPVFFGYEVQHPGQARRQHAPPGYHQAAPPAHHQAARAHHQAPHAPAFARRPLPASMGFSAPPMKQERQHQNPMVSYYQAFQTGATLEDIDSGLFGNYDITVDTQPQPMRAMYMTDQFGNEVIVPQEQSTNQSYRLHKS